MASRTVLEENLAILRERNPALVASLEAASCEGIEEVEGPRGARVLREDGVLLGSAYDPTREAERMAETMAAEPADLMLAVGFGLGEQFEPYLEKNPGTLIVFEPSKPRLRAALSRFSIGSLMSAHSDVHFVADLDQLSLFLDARYVSGLRLRVFPHPAVLRLDREAVAAAVERTRRVKEAADVRTVTSIDQMIPWAAIVAGNGARIASRPGFGSLAGRFEGKPAVIVAAGPSLDKQLPALAAAQDRVVIIAIGQTVKALRAAGIRPHFVHVLESRNVAHQLLDAGTTTDLNLVLTPDCHPAVYDVPSRSTFVATPLKGPMGGWIAEARHEENLTIGGGTVAQGAVGLASLLCCDPILLIGQDLAFTEGRAYAKGSAYDFVGVQISESGRCEFTNQKQKVELLGDRDLDEVRDTHSASEIVWVDGWEEGERVPTWRAYAAFIEQYRDIGLYLGSVGTRLVNCTEGGARIPQIDHVPFREVLDRCATRPTDAFEIIDAIYQAEPTHTHADFVPALTTSRRVLDTIERELRKARRFAKKAGARIEKARSDQQRVEILQGLARYEKRIRRHLEGIAWLDALVQPEIYQALAAVRRTERQDPSIEELLEESKLLLDAVRNGIARAREWLDAFEASFDESRDSSGKASGRDEKDSGKVAARDRFEGGAVNSPAAGLAP